MLFRSLKAADHIGITFKEMLRRKFDDDQVKAYVETLFPLPRRKPESDRNPRAAALYAARVKRVQSIRESIFDLTRQGRGTDLDGVQGTLWGAFNAVLEYVDHHAETRSDRLAYAMLGTGALIKRKAFDQAVGKIGETPSNLN